MRPPASPERRTTARFVAVGVTASVVSAVAVTAAAAGFGLVDADPIGASTASADCASPQLAYRYAWRSATVYEIDRVTVSGVPLRCQGRPYALRFTQGDSGGATAASQHNGTLDADGETVIDLAVAERPQLPSVNNTTSTLKAVLLIGSS